MRFGCSSPCKFEPKKKPNALHLSLQCPICNWVAKTRSSHPKTRYPPSRLKQPLSLSLLRRICFHSVRRFAVDALSADRFLRMIFNLPPEELDTTMHSPGEYIKQAISTESDVRGSSTTTSLPPAFCELAIPAKTHSTCGVLNYSSKHNRTFITAVLMGNFSASPYSLISTITIIVRPGRSVWRRY